MVGVEFYADETTTGDGKPAASAWRMLGVNVAEFLGLALVQYFAILTVDLIGKSESVDETLFGRPSPAGGGVL